MAIVVEHEKRREEILQKAIGLFCRDGYNSVTFQKIADACGITRTTLYIYFKNKQEIFNFSIKQASSKMEGEFVAIIKDESLSAEKCLRMITSEALDICLEQKSLFEMLVPYLTELKNAGENVDERIRRRTIRLNHLFNAVLIRGLKNGEFREFTVKDAGETIFGLIEYFVLKMVVHGIIDLDRTKAMMNFVIDGLIKV